MFRSIRTKLTATFCGMILLFSVGTGILAYRSLTNYLTRVQQKNQDMLAEALCTAVNYFREGCEEYIYKFPEEEEFAEAADRWLKEGDGEELSQYMNEEKRRKEMVANLFLMKPSYEYIGTGDQKDIPVYMIDRISTAERFGESCVWDSGYNTNSMILFRCIKVAGYGKNLYLFLQIANENVLSLFNRFRLQNTQRFSLKGKTNGFEVTEQGFFYNYYDNYENLLHTQIDLEDWYLRTWTPHTVGTVSLELLYRLALVFAVVLLIAVLLSSIVSRQITKPIKEIKRTVQRYGAGDFEAKVYIKGKDEIADLGNVLNEMSTQITELIQQVTENERQNQYLGLQTLIYQINPHFLYNTLDSINMLARKNNDQQVAVMVTNLSRLFRLGLNRGMDIISLKDEIMHITYYLKIQKFRFEDQLDWDIQIPEHLLNCKIMKFILQPIVENAIYHGIKSKNEHGIITITCTESENTLLLTVEDTGKGMDGDTLEKLNRRINEKVQEEKDIRGYGMWNVNRRIKIFYGEEYGLTIDSVPEQGTKITIRIPEDIGA